MAADLPSARVRARHGSLERPINGRLYRGTWLLVGIPLLIAAFSVGKPTALRAAVPALPPAFDKARAVALTRDLAETFPDRSPGSPGAASARQWFADQVANFGLRVRREPFFATIPGRGRVRLENLIVTIPGRSPQALAVLAHLDDVGTGPGANDNASGVAALVELARSYATSVSGNVPPGASIASPAHTLFFAATDGGEFGGLGARRFAADYRNRVVTAIVLDSIAGRATSRLVIAGDTAREASAGLVQTAAGRIQEQSGELPRRPGAFAQLLDLAFPFTLYEQGPLLSHGVGALTVTTASDRRPPPFSDTPNHLNGGRLAQMGRSAQELLRSLDQGAELVQGTSSYIYLGARVIRGWAVQLVLVAGAIFRSRPRSAATGAGSRSGSGSEPCSSSSRCSASGRAEPHCRWRLTARPRDTGPCSDCSASPRSLRSAGSLLERASRPAGRSGSTTSLRATRPHCSRLGWSACWSSRRTRIR